MMIQVFTFVYIFKVYPDISGDTFSAIRFRVVSRKRAKSFALDTTREC